VPHRPYICRPTCHNAQGPEGQASPSSIAYSLLVCASGRRAFVRRAMWPHTRSIHVSVWADNGIATPISTLHFVSGAAGAASSEKRSTSTRDTHIAPCSKMPGLGLGAHTRARTPTTIVPTSAAPTDRQLLKNHIGKKHGTLTARVPHILATYVIPQAWPPSVAPEVAPLNGMRLLARACAARPKMSL
jgi:hypothetical protein